MSTRCYICRRSRFEPGGDLLPWGPHKVLVCNRCAIMLDAVHRFAEDALADNGGDERQLPLAFTKPRRPGNKDRN